MSETRREALEALDALERIEAASSGQDGALRGRRKIPLPAAMELAQRLTAELRPHVSRVQVVGSIRRRRIRRRA